MKCLIVYYSLDENTCAAAERIAEKTGFDAVRIETVKKMPRSTFLKLIVGGGQVTAGKRPELEIFPIDPDLYDVIILGTPVWADKCAAPVYSFISSIKDHSRIKAQAEIMKNA